MDIVTAMNDRKLFAKTFQPRKPWLGKRPSADTWISWKSFLAALFALPMDAEARLIFQKHTGRTDIPNRQFREAYLVAGRRSGKSIIAALVAVFLAVFRDYDNILAPGETGVVFVLAADRRQARVIFNYIAAFLEAPLLKSMVVSKLKESIELTNRILIEIHTSNYKSVRGPTIVGCVADEVAFWEDENSSNPDTEIFNALRPAMATVPDALLIGISSPYAKRGELYNAYREHFGKSGSDVLVWQADSMSMNPTLPKSVVDKAYVRDASSARAEFGAQFRDDVESFISVETLEARMIPGRRELPYDSTKTYYGFVDPSGGVSDSFTMAIAHLERDRAVLDVLREAQSPLSPEEVTAEFAAIFRAYRISEIEGDRYGGEWPREKFQKHGVNYKVAEKSKSELYLELLPGLMSGQVELLDHPKMVAQLTGLERRTGRGRDSIDHSPGSHDDVANAAAGALGLVLRWNVTGQLGLVELIKQKAQGILSGDLRSDGTRKVNAPSPILQMESSKGVRARWEGNKGQPPKAGPCPLCKSPSTRWKPGGNGPEYPWVILCDCGAEDGVLRAVVSTEMCPTCDKKFTLWAGGRPYCANCGQPPNNEPRPQGVTFARFRSGGFHRLGNALSVDTGRLNNDDADRLDAMVNRVIGRG